MAKYTTNTGIYYIMYTTASHQYRQGKIGKLPLRKCAISYAQEKDPSKINTPFWIANSLHAACCRSVGTTKHGQYLLFCTFGTRTISKFCSSHTAITYLPPLHHLECQTSPLHATPQGSCSRNAPAEEAPGEELQHGWWNKVAYWLPILENQRQTWNNTDQEVSLFNMRGLFFMCHFQTLCVWLAIISLKQHWRTCLRIQQHLPQFYQLTKSLVGYRTHVFSQSLSWPLRFLKPTPNMLNQTSAPLLWQGGWPYEPAPCLPGTVYGSTDSTRFSIGLLRQARCCCKLKWMTFFSVTHSWHRPQYACGCSTLGFLISFIYVYIMI